MSNIQYRSDIDGLRAIAILTVVLFHAHLGLTGGFVGVDVFFVISGFLISSIIVKEANQGGFSFGNFYKRRVLRIFPALFTMLAAAIAIGWFQFPMWNYNQLADSMIAAAAFYSNFYFNNKSDYFAPEAATQPLLHTWSLSVEEQFYFIAPLLLLLSIRYPRYRGISFGFLFVASLAYSVISLRTEPPLSFYMLPSRAFELMMGIALTLGFVPAIRRQVVADVVATAGLLLICAASVFYTEETPFPGFAALLPCFGAAMIIHANSRARTWVGQLLSTRPFLFFGKISYSFYLWHAPILAFGAFRYGSEFTIGMRMAAVAVSVALSWLSYTLIEQPVRRRGSQVRTSIVLLSAVLCILAAYGVQRYIRTSDGVAWRLPPAAATFAAENPVEVTTRNLCRDPNGKNNKIGSDCEIGAAGDPQFLLFGDSHAQAIATEVADLARRQNLAGHALIAGGCPATVDLNAYQATVFSKCIEHYAGFDAWLANPSIKTVVMVTRWATYDTGETMPNESRKSRRVFGPGDTNRNAFEDRVFHTVDKIRAAGKNVAIIGPIPELGFNLPAEMTKALMQHRSPVIPIDRQSFDLRQAGVMDMLARLDKIDGVDVFYPHTLLCDEAQCRTELDGKALYVDDDHLSPEGARFLEPLLKQALAGRREP